MFLSFCILDDFFQFKKIGFWGIFGLPYRSIGPTIRISPEMLCLPYAGFFLNKAVELVGGVSVIILMEPTLSSFQKKTDKLFRKPDKFSR